LIPYFLLKKNKQKNSSRFSHSYTAHPSELSWNLYQDTDSRWTGCCRWATLHWWQNPGCKWDQSHWSRLSEVIGLPILANKYTMTFSPGMILCNDCFC